MTKQILFYPRVFINNAKFFFCVDIEIVSTLLIQKNILSIEDFKTASNIIVF